MKTKYKIRILFISVITVLILFILGYQYIRNREINFYLKSKKLSDVKVVEKVLDLKAASFLKPTIDNSAWDGMVEFVKNPDKDWAEENIASVRKTFNMDFIGVFDKSGKNFYSTADTSYNLLKISDSNIKDWFGDKKTVHTFIMQNDFIYEIFAAVVVPSFDINYTTESQGYYVTAKRWDSVYISEISKLTGFVVELNIIPGNNDSLKNGSEELIYKDLNDYKNKPVAKLKFIRGSEFQSELSNIRLLLFIGFSVLILTIFIFVYLTNRWLTNPLRDITESLIDGDLKPILGLLKKKNEFGDIANLVKKFNEQKVILINEIKEKTEATEKYKALLDAQPDLIFILNKDGTYIDFYSSDISVMTENRNKLIGKNVNEYLDHDIAKKIQDTINKVLSNQTVEPLEYDLNLINGRQTYEARFVSLSENRILSIVRNITERRLSEEAIKNEKQLSDTIIDTLPGSFFMTDFEGNYIRKNKYTSDIRMEPDDETKEDNVFRYVYKEDLAAARKVYQYVIDKGHAETELRFEFKPGTIRWFYISSQRLITQNNNYIIGTGIDITHRKEVEKELISAKEKAEESERLKTNFLSNMSHELRTPMVGILGYSDLLRNELVDDEQYSMADKIFKSGNRLMETLNLILDLSRIEAGKLEAKYSVFDISDSVENAVSLYMNLIESKGLNINYLNRGSNIYVNLDERMVRDILYNIINNAIKYTNEGSITICAEKIMIDGIPYVRIETSDTGIGIPADKLDVIFDEFRQVSEGLSRGFEGTGLGLTLTKKFTEKMKGSISVSSELGKGSVFTITLPVNINTDTHKEVNYEEIEKSNVEQFVNIHNKEVMKRILVVDNDETTLMLVGAFLNENFSLDNAKTGKEAISLANLNKFDLILMDINLGDNDNGLTVAKKIKEIQGFRDVPVIAITAYAMMGDKEKFIEGGCVDYISKPFVKADLLNAVNNALKL